MKIANSNDFRRIHNTWFVKVRMPLAVALVALSITAYCHIKWESVAQAYSTGSSGSLSLVISQVYAGGGSNNTSATFQRDFIEIFNRSTTPISLNGFSLQYITASGTTVTGTIPLNDVTLQPGQYYLVVTGTTGTGGVAVPNPDQTATSPNLAATGGRVALVNSTNTTGIADDPPPLTGTPSVIDYVGYGNATVFEGTAAAPPSTINTSIARTASTNSDTDNNNTDFVSQLPNPRNSSSPGGIPTLAKLNSFSAYISKNNVTLKWQTGYEVNNLGYNIYREQNGTRTLLNKSIIAGSAFMVGAGTRLVAGRIYSWSDRLASDKQEGAQYWLEEIDLDGTRTMHNPVTPNIAAPSEKSLPVSSAMLNELAAQNENPMGNVESQWMKSSLRLASNSSPQAFTTQQMIAAGSAVKIAVKRAGWYRVTQAELVAAGLDANTDPRRLRLYADGNEVPMRVVGEETGAFGADKYIEFYGIGFDTTANDTRTYWLVAGEANGKRIQFSAAPKGGRAFRGRTQRASAASVAPNSFAFTIERKDRFLYFSNLRNGDADNFFGNVITTNEHTETLTARDLALSSATPNVRLEVALQGASAGEHQVALFFNDAKVGTLNYTGLTRQVTTLDVPSELLREGANNVKLVAETGSSDVSLVDYLRLTYPRRLRAVDNNLVFSLGASQTARIENFTSSRVRIFDVTDADNVKQIAATLQAQTPNNFAASFTTSARPTSSTYVALAEDTFMNPVSVTRNNPSNLHDTAQGSDLVIITTAALRESVNPLVSLRQAQGLRVAVVEAEDIFDEWNFGHPHSASSVHEFLRYAKENRQRSLMYVLLVGDATFDSRGYTTAENINLVPTKLIDTASMETASDEWLVDFDDDGIGEMAIGRLPARDALEAGRMIGKIVNHDARGTERKAVLFADSRQRDGNDFVAMSQAAAATLPATIAREEINRNPDEAATRTEFIDAVNRGALIVNYVGHGSVDLWSGAGFFSNDDARTLSNDSRLPLFTLMTCLNGYYIDPNLDGLAEALLKAENGGAVAVWASSGMTVPQSQALINQELYRGLFAENPTTLGDAIRRAKAATTDADVRRTWILFGDPSMRFQ